MAISANAAGNGLSIASAGFDFAPVTVAFRFRYDGTNGDTFSRVFEILDPSYNGIRAQVNTSTGQFGIYAQASPATVYWTTALTEGQWYDVVVVWAATGSGNATFWIGRTGHLDEWDEVAADGPGGTYTASWAAIVQNPNAGRWWNGAIDGFKLWTAALSAAEAARERVRRPVRTADLFWWLPQIGQSADGARTDYSGGARNWTVEGTPTYEDGGPAPWGAPIILPQAPGIALPTLSLPGVTDITATSVRPKVTLTF